MFILDNSFHMDIEYKKYHLNLVENITQNIPCNIDLVFPIMLHLTFLQDMLYMSFHSYNIKHYMPNYSYYLLQKMYNMNLLVYYYMQLFIDYYNHNRMFILDNNILLDNMKVFMSILVNNSTQLRRYNSLLD